MIVKCSAQVILALIGVIGMVALVHALPPGNSPPTIGTPIIQPLSPRPGDAVTVSVNVTDNRGVQNVTVVYTTDSWKTVNASITASYNATSGVAKAEIPGLPFGGHVAYYIVAFDTDGNRTVNRNNGAYFSYDIPALSPTSITTLAFAGVLAGVAIGVIAYVMLKHRSQGSRKAPRTAPKQF